MADMKDVARHARVSFSTVSRVLNDYPYVSDQLRERVLHAASTLGFRTNPMAQGMRSGRPQSLGLIVRDMRSANFAEICAAAEGVAEDNNYVLFVCNSNRSTSRERGYIESLLARKLDGFIICPVDDRISNVFLISDNDLPIGLVSSSLTSQLADYIDTCDEAAAIIATQTWLT